MASSSFQERARFLTSEFFVIVLGVLVALGVDEFRSERGDRALEREYGTRVIEALENDSTNLAWFEGVLSQKAGLLRGLLQDPERFTEFEDPDAKMDSLVYSTFVGLPSLSDETFVELQSTGRLGLLESSDLRSALGLYYAEYARMTEILDERFGIYREMVFAAVPGDLHFAARLETGAVDPEELAVGLQRLAETSGVFEAANAELAYTASMLYYLDLTAVKTDELLASLREVY